MSDPVPAKPPTPPPLPPQSKAQHMDQRPSQYLANLEAAGDNVWITTTTDLASPTRYTPTVYFFYGTLTRPDILKRILDLDHDPVMRPAKIIGYSLAKWGDYKALIDGETGEEVAGTAYEVRSSEHAYKLAYYETNAYEVMPCLIDYTDGQEPIQSSGSTFKYAGDAAALKEGRFDKKLWEFRMGSKLPEKWNGKGGG
ncbi:uncharacterized protein GGS22DRAFT_184156 [Annulohypoxylon maeteangense]|uniref:uncharacterized protein n=1 Tax=Annulohypoxylon maeteangense TaxID=1927788 RepID=UPI002007E220|nr:uncharacterized protein GGS22DRAFT_184156 [Annulohypoxylon maeteangense]KAI0888577.1 hypothetical protein GGS22DRAFT_184156 [Annulohypoxylon maeteangense]